VVFMAKSINLSGLSCADNRAIILPSRLFDPSYYLSKNKDVKQAKIDPLNHFINYGAKEGRNPNAAFDIKYFIETYMKEKGQTNPLVFYIKTKKIRFKSLAENFDADFYLKSNPDVYNSKMDPLAHYLNYGIKEGREGCHTQYNNFNKNLPSSYLSYQFPNWINTCNYPATVVVPIFNAYSETKDCVVSLLKHVDLLTDKILFINDCSTDIRIKDLLASLTNIKNITIITNDTNLGYTNSVNLGIDNSIGTDVVLLNSDTRVTPNWLRNFKLAAYENDAIGTVTAVSNGAGAFSVPEAGLHDLPEGFNEVDMARLIQSCGPHERVEVPTGNGFCLFIKRSMLDVIGKFDASLFPRGYGEENYFCMQAIDHGFCNIVDPNTYVFHVRNASFKEEKQLLIDKGIAEVIREFPEYRSIVKMIGDSTHFKTTRGRIRNALLKSSSSANVKNPRILYVISTRTGGTPQTNHDLMRGVAHCFNSIALACNRNTIEILEATKQGYRVIEEFVLGDPIKFAYHRSKEYDSIFKWVLFKYGIELVHVRHLAWQSLNIFAVCRSMGVPAVNSFHDFYTICPTVNLIDDNGQFYPTGVTSPAKNPLWDDKNIVDYTSASSNRWKAKMSLALNMANAYVTTCESAKSILVKALPGVFVSKAPDCFSVFPHGRDFEKFYQYAEPPIKDKPLRVLLPGNISLSKGAKTVKAIKELDNEGLIEFHVLGTCIGELIPYVKCHGAYDRDDFSQRVKAIRPHIAAVLSIWPETYCHTLTESWACGVPVLGVNLGAVGDRIAQHGGGWLAENDPQQVYQQLVNIDLASWETKVESTIAWQSHYGADNTIASMATKYIGLYNNLLRQQRSEIPRYFQKIGLVMKGEFPNVPPTAYVRIVD
jgi:GT2 family glycosyltransferase/glycosyltransferase involved in cell wall biosynthesis